MYILAAENSWASVGHNNLQERKRERERFKRYLIEFVDGWKRLWTWEKLYIRHTHGFVWIMKTVCEWERFWVWRTFWVWLGEKFIHMCVNWERERERERERGAFINIFQVGYRHLCSITTILCYQVCQTQWRERNSELKTIFFSS